MANLAQPKVSAGAFLTLHYRLASQAGGDIINTFGASPATLQIGGGQVAPFLEECLIGLAEGAHQTFELSAEQAFGARNSELLQRVSRSTLTEHSSANADYAIGDSIEFNAPGGGRFAGILRELGSDDALFDFNHPLAGQALLFEVKLIAVL